MPSGDVESLKGLEILKVEETSVEACRAACCALGPNACQYMWFVRGNCLAVSCSERDQDQCEPFKISSTRLVSTYFKIGYDINTGAYNVYFACTMHIYMYVIK